MRWHRHFEPVKHFCLNLFFNFTSISSSPSPSSGSNFALFEAPPPNEFGVPVPDGLPERGRLLLPAALLFKAEEARPG
jgi:hypothetical protein